jgi:hypothetical protein
MIRFFRPIRQRFLSENKFRRYLLYAVGEILLVVIGILIALQVDNWNKNRSQQKEAVTFYQNTMQQLLEDRQNFQSQIEHNNRNIGPFNYAIALIGANNRIDMDSLGSITGMLVDYSDFDRQGNIYETIVNSGDVKLLKNEEIKKRLRRLEQTYLYSNRMETIHYDALMLMIPDISKTVNIISREVVDADGLFSANFQNCFALSLRIIREKDAVYRRGIEEIDAIIALIEEELKQS